jgi:hypothetical protein
MRRFLSSVLTASLVALLAVPALADSGAAGSGMSAKSAMTGSMAMQHSCPKGQIWVKGYQKKGGTQVKGYCRGAKATSAKPTPVRTRK